MKAMVLDDDPMVRSYLGRLLSTRGYEVLSFPDPAASPCPVAANEACVRSDSDPCTHVIFCDIQMPNINGLDFVERQLRQGCKRKHIAMISGCWSEDHLDRARQLPVKILAKPLGAGEVNAWLDEVEERAVQERTSWGR